MEHNMPRTLSGVPTHDGMKFTWDCGQGATFASDLGLRPHMSRVWDDACDEGFWMVSHRSGERRLFVLTKAECNADNEVVAWHFQALKSDCNGRPIRVVIFND